MGSRSKKKEDSLGTNTVYTRFKKMTDAILQSSLEVAIKALTVAVFNAYMEMERNQFIQAQAYERG